MKNDTPGLEAISALGWETIESQRTKSKTIQMYQVLNELAPNALVNLLCAKVTSQIMSSWAPLPLCKYFFPELKI